MAPYEAPKPCGPFSAIQTPREASTLSLSWCPQPAVWTAATLPPLSHPLPGWKLQGCRLCFYPHCSDPRIGLWLPLQSTRALLGTTKAQRQSEAVADFLFWVEEPCVLREVGQVPRAPGGPPTSRGMGSGKASRRRWLFSCSLHRRYHAVQRPRGRSAGTPVENLFAEAGT